MVPLVSPQLAAFRDRSPSLPCSRWVLGYPPLQDRIGQALFMPCRLSGPAIIYGLLKEYRETVRWGIRPDGERTAFYWQQASLDAGQSMHVHHLPIFLYSLFSWPGISAVVLRLQSPSGQIEKEGTITSDERVLFVLSSTSLWTPVRFDGTVLR